IENGALCCFAAGQTPVLHNAVVPVILAVLPPVGAAQKHLSAAECQRSKPQKRGKVFTWLVSPAPSLKAKRILPSQPRKSASSAKVRLALAYSREEPAEPSNDFKPNLTRVLKTGPGRSRSIRRPAIPTWIRPWPITLPKPPKSHAQSKSGGE